MSAVIDLIRRLELQPHPEGGHYAETYRHKPEDGGRGTCTAIYYLLAAGESSHWHKVDAVEIWNWHAGEPLALSVSDDGVHVRELVLGPDIALGQVPQAVVPAGAWQAARPLGEYALVGCIVAPAFEFSGFTMAPPKWKPGKGE